ncbi:MAG: hypothetical protein FWC83_02410, partial [Alphaproteobacteria bacterium]|nr:hypothetical protein [Alphaproteobacteria bacterium]
MKNHSNFQEFLSASEAEIFARFLMHALDEIDADNCDDMIEAMVIPAFINTSEQTHNLIKQGLENGIKMQAGTYSRLCCSYPNSNELPTKLIPMTKPAGKSVLTVAGSGDQPLLFAAHGAKLVDTFDITLMSKLVMDVKREVIPNISHKDYIKVFDNIQHSFTKDDYRFNIIRPYLSEDTLKSIQLLDGQQYITIPRYGKQTAQFNKKTYQSVQKIADTEFN